MDAKNVNKIEMKNIEKKEFISVLTFAIVQLSNIFILFSMLLSLALWDSIETDK